jgi:hypothetical protein
MGRMRRKLLIAAPLAALAMAASAVYAVADPGGSGESGPAPLSGGPFVECLREQGVPIPEWQEGQERPKLRDLDIDREAMRSSFEACRGEVPRARIRAYWDEQITPEQRQAFARCVKDAIDPAAEHPIREAMQECQAAS